MNNLLRIWLVYLALIGTPLPAALSDVAGTLYEEYFQPQLSPNAFRLYHFRADGTYILLSNDIRSKDITTPLPGKGSHLPMSVAEEVGTYSYSLDADARSATLRLGSEVRRLEFSRSLDNGTTGSIGLSTSFRFYLPAPNGVRTNFSNRGYIAIGRPSVSGFVLDKGRWALIRVIGPSLEQFGIQSPIQAPVMTLYREGLQLNGGRVFEMRGWLSTSESLRSQLDSVFAMVGAFPLPKGSADCAVLRFLDEGVYTVHAATEGSEVGSEVLTEVYYLPFQ